MGWAAMSNKLPGCHLANAWRSRSKHILQWRYYRNEVSVHSFIHSSETKLIPSYKVLVPWIFQWNSSGLSKEMLEWVFGGQMSFLMPTSLDHGRDAGPDNLFSCSWILAPYYTVSLYYSVVLHTTLYKYNGSADRPTDSWWGWLQWFDWALSVSHFNYLHTTTLAFTMLCKPVLCLWEVLKSELTLIHACILWSVTHTRHNQWKNFSFTLGPDRTNSLEFRK